MASFSGAWGNCADHPEAGRDPSDRPRGQVQHRQKADERGSGHQRRRRRCENIAGPNETPVTFFFDRRRLKSQSHQNQRNTTPDLVRRLIPQRNRCSPTTSAVDGVGPSHPPPPLASNRDCENALALLHAMMVIHRWSHAALARVCWGAAAGTPASQRTTSRPLRKRGPRALPAEIDQSAGDTFSLFFVWQW